MSRALGRDQLVSVHRLFFGGKARYRPKFSDDDEVGKTFRRAVRVDSS
jgi:hypothetical protein